MKRLLNLWSSMTCTESDVVSLATAINYLITKEEDKVAIINLSSSWWMIVGNEQGQKAMDKLKRIAAEHS
jgi:hypothetical protein